MDSQVASFVWLSGLTSAATQQWQSEHEVLHGVWGCEGSLNAMSTKEAKRKTDMKDIFLGTLVLLSAVPIALAIYFIHEPFPGQPERAVPFVALFFTIIFALSLIVYVFYRRRFTNPWKLGLVALVTISVLMVSIYLYRLSFVLVFPADFFIWSESQFVNDILKFRIGYPLYTEGGNHESFIYPPGAQLITFLMAWMIGKPTSIFVYRMIQVVFTLLTAVVAVVCCHRMMDINPSNRQDNGRWPWGILWLPVLFLMATNSITNAFVHHLHNDSLALLVAVTAYYLLLKYELTRDMRVLAMMALIPALGFLVKQSLVIWSLLYFAHLAMFEFPRSMRRILTFVLISFSGYVFVLASCYFLWGKHFFYWTFTVVRARGGDVALMRSFQHILDAWPYFVIGLVGGAMIIRDKKEKAFLSAWIIWIILILSEAYTSGIGWTRTHMGPGSVIAGIWFLSAISKYWPLHGADESEEVLVRTWLRTSVSVVCIGLLFSGLGMLRIPTKPFPVEDAYRYVREIEKEFQGEDVKNVLLDVGTWVYVGDQVIKKDSAIPIGDQGFSETHDFSGFKKRLQERRYSKILVRNLHRRDFWYDVWFWRKSSGIKRVLQDNYDEVRSIDEVKDSSGNGTKMYTFGKISILTPKAN